MSVKADILYLTEFTCNEPHCGASQTFDLGKVQATARAKEVGWTIARAGMHYCPSHPRARGRRPSDAQTA